ncbi:MAG: hypothetical protein WA001_01765 [Patescibacteria group bacterium]
MKKLLFALAAVPLLAAGCNSSTSGSVSVQPTAPPAVTQPTQTPPPSDNTQTPPPVQSNVQVNSAADALDALDKGAADEQAKASAGDDTDLTASDSAAVNGLYGATNGY